MKRKAISQFVLGGILLILFVLFTWSLTSIDVQPIGPNSSSVAYASINHAVHKLFGVNMTLYNITDWAGVVAIFIALGFAVLGLVQWIKRKHILKVDSSILILGMFYVLVFGAYVFFEFHVINRRPVLINGILEASYPSSTTMLAMCVLPTAMMQFHRLIKNTSIRNTVNTLCGLFTAFMVIGRLVCGVHWFTDILGGLIFSVAIILLYCSANNYILIKEGGKCMKYPLSEKYNTPELMSKIMGPNPVKLEEELLTGHRIPAGSVVCDLGSGQGLTSVFLAKEYGFTVYAADLWSDPEDNRCFFREMELTDEQIIPVKADATALPFEAVFLDAIVSTDSYNYFGRDPEFLDRKLLPYVKNGGYVYIAIPGMKQDCHDNLPPELLLSWTPEQMDYMHDVSYWRNMVSQSQHAEIIEVSEMVSNEEVWKDWLEQENEYAIGDRKSMEAGGGKYLNFIKIVLRKKTI